MTQSAMYFVAVICPPEVNAKVIAFKQRMKERFGCVAALKSPAHITLIPPFWFKEAEENALLQATASFKSIPGDLIIQLDGFSHFDRKTLFVEVQQSQKLSELKRKTEDYFIQAFKGIIEKDKRPFCPHITIANRDLKPSDFEKAWEYFSAKKFSATFGAEGICLLKLSPEKWNVICTTGKE